ncbi:hypothetical protein AKJ09_06926 [Labilithrix luteola]|uniref:Uncharacterized protein n=1 Tax=Labilithrix luteola TaxID=1391654 RepID=A0A0K1Q3F9_9BACT|nr:hypothetical protein AKJ09_06926 [Labilithrix luteola]
MSADSERRPRRRHRRSRQRIPLRRRSDPAHGPGTRGWRERQNVRIARRVSTAITRIAAARSRRCGVRRGRAARGQDHQTRRQRASDEGLETTTSHVSFRRSPAPRCSTRGARRRHIGAIA